MRREIRFFVAHDRDAIRKQHAKGEPCEAEEIAIIARHVPAGVADADVGNHAVLVAKFLAPAIEMLRLGLLLNDRAARR